MVQSSIFATWSADSVLRILENKKYSKFKDLTFFLGGGKKKSVVYRSDTV